MPCLSPPPVTFLPLVHFEPHDLESCAGVAPPRSGGLTTVAIKWVSEGDSDVDFVYQSGDFQVFIEKTDGAGCHSLEADSGGPRAGLLNPADPDAAIHTDYCQVVRHNSNDTAVVLETGEKYRWRVRRIEDAVAVPAGFGPWTQWSEFTVGDAECISQK